MSHQPFDFQDLLQLVELMKSTTQFSEFRLRAGGIELELRRGPATAPALNGAAAMPAGATVPTTGTAAPTTAAQPAPSATTTAEQAKRPAAPAAAARTHPPGATVVTAPMVGTVYLAPEPGARPFVSVGQAVEAGSQLCIVEVMKLMNSVTAGCRGVVAEILVGDADAVEFGQPLFVVVPA